MMGPGFADHLPIGKSFFLLLAYGLVMLGLGLFIGTTSSHVPEPLTAADRAEPTINAIGPELRCSDGTELQCLDSTWSFEPMAKKIRKKP